MTLINYKRARHLTAELALEIKLMIPTIETNEVPFQWNL
jgi:hypothetical protein